LNDPASGGNRLRLARVNGAPASGHFVMTAEVNCRQWTPPCPPYAHPSGWPVGHTGADGFKRLANQALFAGAAVHGATYLIVDDFVGQGGTLANLIGFIRSQGGEVLGASVLTGKPYSAKLAPDEGQINALRHKHGRELETWWGEKFGFDFDRLTRSEARYLEKTADAHTIRSRIAAAGS